MKYCGVRTKRIRDDGKKDAFESLISYGKPVNPLALA